MKKKEYSKEELVPEKITLTLKAHITRDLKAMAEHTKTPIDELVATALSMFIATHNDYLGKYKP